MANYLAENGIIRGDNIAVILPNCPEFAFAYFAVAKLGAIFSPIDTRDKIQSFNKEWITVNENDLPLSRKYKEQIINQLNKG